MTGEAADLRVLTEYCDQLVNERTATANRVHTDLLWLRPGYQDQLPHLTHMAHLHAALELLSGERRRDRRSQGTFARRSRAAWSRPTTRDARWLSCDSVTG
jgi:hypothetical protein